MRLVLVTFLLSLSCVAQVSTFIAGPRPPKFIHIGDRVIKITVVDKKPFWKEKGVVGWCDDWDKGRTQIFVVQERPVDMAHTILHEIMHAIVGTNLSPDRVTIHDFVYKLEPGLLETIFTDNPDLLVYFIAASYRAHKTYKTDGLEITYDEVAWTKKQLFQMLVPKVLPPKE